MKTIKPKPQRSELAAELKLIQQDAAALASVPEAAWQSIRRRLNTAIDDSTEASQEMNIVNEDRVWLAGGAYHLREVWRQLDDLKSGAWRQWPGMPAEKEQVGERESE